MCLEPYIVKFSNLNEIKLYIDGSNVAYSHYNLHKKPILSNILFLFNYLIENLGFSKNQIHCICDPSLRYYIDKPLEYKVLIKEGVIIEAPKVADEFILSFALKKEFCFIISNDRFKEYLDQLPSRKWLEDRRISFMIIDNEVCLSPNINFDRIKNLNQVYDDSILDKEQEDNSSTLKILEQIENKPGKFDLF